VVSGIVRTYLLDVQPGLVKVLAATTPGDMTRFVHGPRGLHAQEDNAGNWTWPLPDGLGSVRSVIKNALDIDSLQTYAPYGEPLESGIFGTPFTFTGEMVDGNGLVYLRARYYDPGLGVFPSLDPVENLNRYQYVGANPANFTDPGGQDRVLATVMSSGLCSPPRQQPDYSCECCEGVVKFLCENVFTNSLGCECGPAWRPHIFPDSEYPTSCDLFPTAETCMLGHLWQLESTETMRYLHNKGRLSLDDMLLFASFVAPDPLWYEYNPAGTPADIKSFYRKYQEETNEGKCITLYDMSYGRDVPGNIIFGYLARYAGISPGVAAGGAGLAQLLDDLRTGSEMSSVNFINDLGDSPEDQAAIIMGMALYDICGGFTCTHDNFRAVLEAYRNAYIQAAAESNRAECRPSS